MSRALARLREAGRVFLKPVGIMLGAVSLILLLWWLPRYQVTHTPGVTGEKRFESEDEARKTLAQMLGGAVVLLGLYFSAKTFGLSREGQLTERYTKAIEQLGKSDAGQPNIEVRLGAIYALERIAIDSPRDHWTIMEVLTAYVRRNAPLEPEREYEPKEMPRTEIQAILTVIGRRRVDEGRERKGQTLDLTRSRLWNADLNDANLAGAWMSFADLRGARLASANLRDVRLWSADLWKAYLHKADMRGAKCFLADFHEANFSKADLREADLMASRFEGATLSLANLQGADLNGANFLNSEGLKPEQIRSARGWEAARYPANLRNELGLAVTEESAEEDAS